jgi:hypothetical protein
MAVTQSILSIAYHTLNNLKRLQQLGVTVKITTEQRPDLQKLNKSNGMDGFRNRLNNPLKTQRIYSMLP